MLLGAQDCHQLPQKARKAITRLHSGKVRWGLFTSLKRDSPSGIRDDKMERNGIQFLAGELEHID
jgi:hypothetical protein